MDFIYLGIVIFLFALAAFCIHVGVSNQAVNFLSNAIGSKAAPLKLCLILAAIGLMVGAITSNGMMDVARHGILKPTYFYLDEVMYIFLAVVVSDIIILDIFNMLGMPTSTTVSMVFELLGGSTALALVKMAKGNYQYSDLINTEKAMTVIMGIFLSVAIAFILGLIVMWLARLIFTFNYKHHLSWFIGIFGGFSITGILFFLLTSGLGDAAFMTPDVKEWISQWQGHIFIITLVASVVLMQMLHWCKVNVLKIVVLFGTFSLAMAFAGNDMVNFIGIPLAGFSAYEYYIEAGGGDVTKFCVSRLSEPADTPIYFLIISGIIMILSITTSKKAQRVIQTSVNLSSQNEGEEVFSSSRLARTISRSITTAVENTVKYIPSGMRTWVGKRFNTEQAILADGAAFDLIRASINLVLAGLLIMIGTSWQLPLSTTYVAFMVAMGASLADRAWGRETAVYRITGVISVIGGWFITAGVAFFLCFLISLFMYYIGFPAVILSTALVIYLFVHNGRKAKKQDAENQGDTVFHALARCHDGSPEAWELLSTHVCQTQSHLVRFTAKAYRQIIEGLTQQNLKHLRRAASKLETEKSIWKKMRRKEILGMRKIDYLTAVEKNTWFHLGCNNMSQTIYCLKRMLEPIIEHVDNNFNPLPKEYAEELKPICDGIEKLFGSIADMLESGKNYQDADKAIVEANVIKSQIMQIRSVQQERIRRQDSNIKIDLLYLSTLQETQEIISAVRHLLRASRHFHSA